MALGVNPNDVPLLVNGVDQVRLEVLHQHVVCETLEKLSVILCNNNSSTT